MEKYPLHFEGINRGRDSLLGSRKGNGPYLGNSTCQYYAKDGEEKVTIGGRITGTRINIKIRMNNLVKPQAPLNDTYFVCGHIPGYKSVGRDLGI